MAWAPPYVTNEAFADYARIGDLDDDAQITLAVEGASRVIDQHCNRQFGVVDAVEERTYTACADYKTGRWSVEVDDFMTATGLVVEVDSGTVTTFTTSPVNAAQKARPWTRIVFTADSEFRPSASAPDVAVTALWGWAAVPTTIEQATMLQASRMFTRRNAPFGVAGSPETGSEVRLLAKVDPDVAVALSPFVRWWGAA